MRMWRCALGWALFAAMVSGLISGLAAAQQQNPPAASSGSHPQVILSRSAEQPTQSNAGQEKSAAAAAPAKIELTDAERRAITVLSYDLDVQLRPREQSMAARARMVVRNDGHTPLTIVPLQISSTLSWVDVRIASAPASFAQQTVKSDTDHTGSLNEAAIQLRAPLAPGATLELRVTYQGTVAESSQRLDQIGTPPDLAHDSDWDRISEDFVGLRGLGNVVWYPVASVPVRLGDGDRLFAELGEAKQRESDTIIAIRVTAEFYEDAPNVAVLEDRVVPVTLASQPAGAEVPGIAICSLPATRLGFAVPSLFVLKRSVVDGNGARVFARTENVPDAQSYLTAATIITPLLQQWLGAQPREPLSVVDLAAAADAPVEGGAVLLAPLVSAAPEKLASVLVHPLTQAYFASRYVWLQQGVAFFMATLNLERNFGREVAIQQLDNQRAALSLAEPADPAAQPGQSLLEAHDAAYYRTKATYVFWMLRDIAGDDALKAALRSYNPSADPDGRAFERTLEKASGKDLAWFFNDWVYRDRSLPDLSIAGVYPNNANVPGSYIVAVDIANDGYAEAEVPVSVRSEVTTVTERLRIPARSRVSHRFLLQGKPVEAQVNDGTVPEMQASVHRQPIANGTKE